jgi:hypothetical protein
MDQDPCVGNVGWSVLGGAAQDSTLAGVLAGFLIVAATALLVQWNDRSDPDTFALFASGVPVLTLSSYLFTLLSGTKPGTKPDPKVCGQVWSQWLPAFAMLLIGASVLLCGLGWALVSYSDNLAVKLIEKNRPMKRVEESRRFFISLSACLSLGGTTAMACWLIAATIIFLKATTGRQVGSGKDQQTIYPFFEFLHVKWYLMFFVFLFGLYVVVRSAYLIIWRTRAARQENVASCTGYVPGVYDESSTPLDARDNKPTERVAKEICIAAAIALGALLAEYLTNQAVGERFSGTTTSCVVGVVVVGYVIARLAYYGIVRLFGPTLRKQRTTESFAEADVMIRRTPSTEIPEDAIRIKYSLRRLGATSYHVVVFAILGTVFAAALTQGSLSPNWRTGLSLLVGGLYPAGMLLGLSYAVPAGPAAKLPEWKTWPGLRLIP